MLSAANNLLFRCRFPWVREFSNCFLFRLCVCCLGVPWWFLGGPAESLYLFIRCSRGYCQTLIALSTYVFRFVSPPGALCNFRFRLRKTILNTYRAFNWNVFDAHRRNSCAVSQDNPQK